MIHKNTQQQKKVDKKRLDVQPVPRVTNPHIDPQSHSWRAQGNKYRHVLLAVEMTGRMLIQTDRRVHFSTATSPTVSVRWNQGHGAFGCEQTRLKHPAALASTSSVTWGKEIITTINKNMPLGAWCSFWILKWRWCHQTWQLSMLSDTKKKSA